MSISKYRFPGGLMVKDPPANAEDMLWSLGEEDPLKEMAAHSSILAWKFHGYRSLVRCSSWDRRVRHDLPIKQQ